MRQAVVLNLIVVILLCPFVCGSADVGQAAHRHRPTECSSDGPTTPVHCPDEGTSCLCQGAIRTGEVRSDDPDAAALLGSGAWCFALTPLLQHRVHPSGDARLAAPSPSGDPPTARALLQNFRC